MNSTFSRMTVNVYFKKMHNEENFNLLINFVRTLMASIAGEFQKIQNLFQMTVLETINQPMFSNRGCFYYMYYYTST